MSWKCPKCGELDNSKKRVNCDGNSAPLKINAKPKQPRVRKSLDSTLLSNPIRNVRYMRYCY